jgi:hypothetical protein
MAHVSPTRKSESGRLNAGNHAVKVVSKHRLAEGSYSTVFPQDDGLKAPRNGHLGSHSVKPTLTK